MPDRAVAVWAAPRKANDGCTPEGPVESGIAIDGVPPQTQSQQHAVPVSLSLARFRSSTKLSKTEPRTAGAAPQIASFPAAGGRPELLPGVRWAAALSRAA